MLRGSGQEVTFLDSNPDNSRAAEEEKFRVLFGSGLSESLLQRAELDGRAGCLGMTPNDEANLLFARRARKEFKVPRAWIALRRGHKSVTAKMVEAAGGNILFGEPRNIDLWMLRLERKSAAMECWRLPEPKQPPQPEHGDSPAEDLDNLLLPLAVRRGKKILPVDEQLAYQKEDELFVIILNERRAQAAEWLRARGWQPMPAEPTESTTAGAGTVPKGPGD